MTQPVMAAGASRAQYTAALATSSAAIHAPQGVLRQDRRAVRTFKMARGHFGLDPTGRDTVDIDRLCGERLGQGLR